MGLATVRGVFTEFDGLIEIGEDLSTAKAYAMVNVESLDTNQPQRDEHLRSPDFFDTGQYPGPPLRVDRHHGAGRADVPDRRQADDPRRLGSNRGAEHRLGVPLVTIQHVR